MRERAGHPTIHAVVTLLAVGRISQGHMVGRSRLLKRSHVATNTLGRQPLPVELPHGASFVARITVGHRVSANQRKTILMFVDGMHGDLPATDPMTDVTLRSVPAAVNIGMTILAIASDIRKDWIDVALLAAHIAMHAAQREASLAMIEFGFAADRPPR